MSLYLGSEKVENVTAQITLPVEPSDDLPLADGTASAGVSKKFSRADHVHPMETVEATLVDMPSAEELGAIPAPTSGTTGQVLTKTTNGQKWEDVPIDENSVLLKNVNFTFPVSLSWQSITYGNGKFIAIANEGKLFAYSTDGINWTKGTLPISASWQSIAYGNDKFVAVIYNSNIFAYSTDGINWISSLKKLQSPDGTDIHEQVRTTLQIPEPESEVFTITISGYDGNFTSNKTGVEIQKAYDAGKICVALVRSSDPMFAIQVFENEATFVSYLNYDGTTETYRITYDGTVQYTENNINPKARKVTLTTSGWSNNQQTVTCTGVDSSATSQEIRVMPADASKTSVYVSCGISCVAQASDKLTFACDKVPTTAIDVYVVMQSLNFQS